MRWNMNVLRENNGTLMSTTIIYRRGLHEGTRLKNIQELYIYKTKPIKVSRN